MNNGVIIAAAIFWRLLRFIRVMPNNPATGLRDARIATAARWPGSLQRMLGGVHPAPTTQIPGESIPRRLGRPEP
jgi:hypothetical protein